MIGIQEMLNKIFLIHNTRTYPKIPIHARSGDRAYSITHVYSVM